VLQLDVPEGATVAEALARLSGDAELKALVDRCACAEGDCLVPRGQILSDGMTLALIPPVSGG
jgi:molybdopterin converting factor small subunit